MRTFPRIAFALGLLLLGCSCGNQDWVERLTTLSDRQFGNQVIAYLRAGDIAKLKAVSSPDLSRVSDSEWRNFAASIPKQGDSHLVTASSNTRIAGGKSTTFKSLNYEVGRNTHWAVTQISMEESNHRHTLVGFRIFPSAVQPTHGTEFSLKNKGVLNYAFLAVMLASFIICLTGAFFAYRHREWKGRWFWIIGSLAGIGSVSLAWASGQVGFRLLNFQLLGAGFVKPSPFESWIFSASVPVVALIVIARHFRASPQKETE